MVTALAATAAAGRWQRKQHAKKTLSADSYEHLDGPIEPQAE